MSGVKKGVAQTRDHRVLIMVVVMVICFLLCWLPYGIMALIATFGKPGLITASASIIPSILAKSSTVYNPVIYIFLNKQVSRMKGAIKLFLMQSAFLICVEHLFYCYVDL